jgi:hypothetical protein
MTTIKYLLLSVPCEIVDSPHPTRLGSSPSPAYAGEGRCERSERRGEGL